MKLNKTSLSVALCLVCTSAIAESGDVKVGTQTQSWLELQKSGVQASEIQRPMQGEVAKRSYERYLNSFDNALPTQFDTTGGVSQ